MITVMNFPGVRPSVTLDELVDNMVEDLNFSELVREEVAIASRRTIMIGGYSSRGRLVQANFMLVGTTLYQFAVSAHEDGEVGGLWEDWMMTFVPANAAPLGETIQAPLSKLSLRHPEGWSTAADFPNTYFENADDLKKPAQPTGVIVSLVEMDITGMEMELDNVLALAYQTQGWDAAKIPAVQHIVEYEPAYVIKGESVNAPGFYGIIAALKVGNAAVLVVAVAPSEAQLTAFEPTFYAMLMSASVG